MILSGSAAAAGIARINSVGNLAGYVSPFLAGTIRDRTLSMTLALLALSAAALPSALISLTRRAGPPVMRPEVRRRVIRHVGRTSL